MPLQALLDGHHPSVDFEGKPLPSWLDLLKGKPITGQFPDMMHHHDYTNKNKLVINYIVTEFDQDCVYI